MLFGRYVDPVERLWNLDSGTAEIWKGTDLIALVAVTGSGGSYTERWAHFHGGAKTPDGKLLGDYPSADLPPGYGMSAHPGPVMVRIPAQSKPWSELDASNGSLQEFGDAVLDAVSSVYSVPVGAGLEASTDWTSGGWAQLSLTTQLVAELIENEQLHQGAAIRRWFEARRLGQFIGRLYAEHPSGDTRVFHQISANGIHPGGVGAILAFEGQGPGFTLANFLAYAKTQQSTKGWLYTLGSATRYDNHD